MKQTRKDKLTILKDIEVELVDGIGYNYQQLAKAIGSHWMTIRECCDYLVDKGIIKRIETINHQWVVYRNSP